MNCYDAYGNAIYCAQAAQQQSAIAAYFSNPIFWIIWLLGGIACAMIAASKGRNVGVAVVVGLLTGVIGIVIYACMGKVVVNAVASPETERGDLSNSPGPAAPPTASTPMR
jgi:hypothetical protein